MRRAAGTRGAVRRWSLAARLRARIATIRASRKELIEALNKPHENDY
jgi:hypothetical protein